MLDSPLIHICALAALLFIGFVLRSKVRIFQTYFVPASLIAGVAGLSLGTYGLNVMPDEMLKTFSSLPAILISIVFAPMLMGVQFPRPKEVVATAGPQLLYGYFCDFLLIAVPLLLTVLVIAPIWGVDEVFGTVIEVGFAGGHGTAAGMASVYAGEGWQEGGAIGLTIATIGLFVGIVGGMIIINHGARRGWITSPDFGKNGAPNRAGLIRPDERIPSSYITVDKGAVEPLALQFGFIGLAVIVGACLVIAVERAVGLILPLFPMAMIGGLIVQIVVSRTKFAKTIDPGSLGLIQGLALEFLIVSAIATIELPIVIAYAVPLMLISAASVFVLLILFYVFGPRFFKTDWFEHSIVSFGAFAGVAAVGLMLLRTVDPNLKGETARAFAMQAPFSSPIIGGGLLTTVLPGLVAAYGGLWIGLAALLAGAACVGIAMAMGFWNKSR